MTTERDVRVRFAPSPTGPLHIGGVRTALYNYLFARKYKGTMILRIEDTDQNRFVPGAEQYIKDSLKWVGIELDEGPDQGGANAPYRQSERKPMYRQYADQLLENGFAYYAFDTEEELDAMRKRLEASKMQSAYDAVSRMSMKNSLTLPADEVAERLQNGDNYVIRIKLPRKEEIRFYDIIRGWVTVNTSQMDDKVLLKGDGMPTYHLANVVDDYLMQISHVIRGEEWLPSAPLHYMLYKYLGWQDVMPQFAHLPLLLKPDGNGKLSKRDGDRLGFPVFPLQWTDPLTNEISSGYRERGYFPESVVNMLALLGWHPSDNQEVFSMDELVEAFTLEKVSKSGAKFDLNKALWFNQTYLQSKNVNEIFNSLEDQFKAKYGDFETAYGLKVVELLKEKVQFSNQIVDESGYFFGMPEKYDKQVIEKKFKENTGLNLLSLSNYFIDCKCFSASEFEQEFKAFCEINGLKTGDLLQPLRVAISGEAVGPPIFELLELFGNENVHKRIEKCLSEINLSLS